MKGRPGHYGFAFLTSLNLGGFCAPLCNFLITETYGVFVMSVYLQIYTLSKMLLEADNRSGSPNLELYLFLKSNSTPLHLSKASSCQLAASLRCHIPFAREMLSPFLTGSQESFFFFCFQVASRIDRLLQISLNPLNPFHLFSKAWIHGCLEHNAVTVLQVLAVLHRGEALGIWAIHGHLLQVHWCYTKSPIANVTRVNEG